MFNWLYIDNKYIALHGSCMYCQKQGLPSGLAKVVEDVNLRFKKIKEDFN